MDAALDEASGRLPRRARCPVGAGRGAGRRDLGARAANPGKCARDDRPTAHAEMLAIRAACPGAGGPRAGWTRLRSVGKVTLEPARPPARGRSRRPRTPSVAVLYIIRRGPIPKSGAGVAQGPRVFDPSAGALDPEVYGGYRPRPRRRRFSRRFFAARRLRRTLRRVSAFGLRHDRGGTACRGCSPTNDPRLSRMGCPSRRGGLCPRRVPRLPPGVLFAKMK